MDGLGETPLQMAKRHIAEGEARVTRQRALIAKLRAQGQDTAAAEDLLAEFESALANMVEHLLHVLRTK